MIIEQVDCVADAGNNARRRCRVKCGAAVVGLALLTAVLILGPGFGPDELVADATGVAHPVAGDAHE